MLKPFSVVVVPFPYSDRLAEKRRPALVVSATAMAATNKFWAAMITSKAVAELAGDAVIRDLAVAGLPNTSLVRASKLSSIEVGRVVRVAGSLSEFDRLAARDALRLCAAFA